VVSVIGLLLVASIPASATNFSGASGATGCTATNTNMADPMPSTVWYDALTAAVANAENYVRTNVYNPTDIDTVNDNTEHRLRTSSSVIRTTQPIAATPGMVPVAGRSA
jgi:hypothetical protein